MSEPELPKDKPGAPPTGAAYAAVGVWKNRYVIERELGRGGVGVVYLARDQQLLSKPVVIKVLQDETHLDPYLQKKFQQEIEALARIDHPGVVGVLDVGENPDGKPFLVMQFVEGVNLRSEIISGGMDFRRVAHILHQVSKALGAAHDKGVYHRDLKPENIMLQRTGDSEEYIKLIDFGVAAVVDSRVVQQTQQSKVVGTISYMAPEQLMGHASSTSDIYSLGVIAFEMLTGQRPEVSWKGPAKKPRELRIAISEAAQDVILRALSFQPENRPPTPREFGDQMARALGVEISLTSPLPVVPARVPAVPPSSSAAIEMAYVLFMDIVAYSKLPMDLQSQRIQQLQQTVRSTVEFQRALQSDQVISLPTGDGMALVFFQNPVAPIECATEISRALKTNKDLLLRMGIHTGPVYRIADINTNINVAGGGINQAQRVMDCGDAGHILVSKTVSDILGQLSDWAPSFHDLGEVEVKHGVKVNLVNFYTAEIGNPAPPAKLSSTAPITVRLEQSAQDLKSATQPILQAGPQASVLSAARGAGPRSRWGLMGGLALVLLLAGLTFALLKLGVWSLRFGRPGSAPPTIQSSVGPAAPPAQSPKPPASAVQPPAPPVQPPTGASSVLPIVPPSPGQPLGGAQPPSAPPSSSVLPPTPTPQGRGPAEGVLPRVPPKILKPTPDQAGKTEPSKPRADAPANPSATPQKSPSLVAVEEARERMIQLSARATAISSAMQRMEQQQARLGVGMRTDMSAARESMEYFLGEAKNSLAVQDLEGAKRKMDQAESNIDKLERFLGH